jgi:sugar phosphate isomerase/epimerase
MNRRDLLRTAGAAASAAAFLPYTAAHAAPVPATPPRIRLGIASYTFRNFDTAHLITFMKQLRCTNLNLKDMHLKMTPPEGVAAQAQAFRDAGFKVTGVGNITFFKNDPADMRAKFEYAKAAGVKTIVCAPTRETLPELEKLVKEYDIRLAIHPHGPEDRYFPSPFDALDAIKTMDPRIGVCIDVGHAMRAGADVPKAIRAIGPRLYDMHMKDLANATSKESQVAVGEGIMPVVEIFKALLEIRYPGYVDLEYEIIPDNPLPGVLESFAYMRGILAGMGHADWGFGG